MVVGLGHPPRPGAAHRAQASLLLSQFKLGQRLEPGFSYDHKLKYKNKNGHSSEAFGSMILTSFFRMQSAAAFRAAGQNKRWLVWRDWVISCDKELRGPTKNQRLDTPLTRERTSGSSGIICMKTLIRLFKLCVQWR